jgi:hypothetical protein
VGLARPLLALPRQGSGESRAAAHQRAIALDPAIVTSVSHTHFLLGDYQATLDPAPARATPSTRWYGRRSATLRGRRRCCASGSRSGQLSALMGGLMTSLLAILAEVLFYLARHGFGTRSTNAGASSGSRGKSSTARREDRSTRSSAGPRGRDAKRAIALSYGAVSPEPGQSGWSRTPRRN